MFNKRGGTGSFAVGFISASDNNFPIWLDNSHVLSGYLPVFEPGYPIPLRQFPVYEGSRMPAASPDFLFSGSFPLIHAQNFAITGE